MSPKPRANSMWWMPLSAEQGPNNDWPFCKHNTKRAYYSSFSFSVNHILTFVDSHHHHHKKQHNMSGKSPLSKSGFRSLKVISFCIIWTIIDIVTLVETPIYDARRAFYLLYRNEKKILRQKQCRWQHGHPSGRWSCWWESTWKKRRPRNWCITMQTMARRRNK